MSAPRKPGIIERDASERRIAPSRLNTLASFRCGHLGGPTGRQAKCLGCGQHGRMSDVLACALHGECSGYLHMEGVRSCQGCNDNTARPRPKAKPAYSLVAPLGARDAGALSFLGIPGKKRPWSYPATVALPHLDTLEYLQACVDLIRLQADPPYILVLDTGSPPEVCARLEELRADDLEVHYIRGHGYIHSSQPVCVALDLAFALCRTERLVLMHTDVFLRRRDALKWLLAQVTDETPVVGYQMSPRPDAKGEWARITSHAFTGCWMPAMRRHGVSWSMERWYGRFGRPEHTTMGWPDTESPFLLSLDDAGIVPKLLGPEPNYERHQTEWIDHARSIAGIRVATPAADLLRRKIEDYAGQALAEARERAVRWRREPF